MRAVHIREAGEAGVLFLGEAPPPEPAEGEIRVRVQAAGVNRADLMQRRGRYPAPPGWPADIPGLEYSGIVDSVGPGVGRWHPGDRVMGLVGGGGYAEYVVVHEGEALPVPDRVDLDAAAALPEAFITAHDALLTRGRLAAGEAVLIHAVGSGVGLAGLQVARAVGARTLGTSRTPDKLDRAGELGLDRAIHVEAGGFAEAVREGTGGRGADVVLELVGGPYVAEDLHCTAELGRVVLVGLLAGRSVDLDLGRLLRNRVTLVGTVLRSRSLEEKIAATRATGEFLLPRLESGQIRPVIDRVLPMAEASRAHRLLEADATFGKVVLSWDA